jgi:hypothetical protein
MCIIIPECLNNSNEMRGKTEKCFFFFFFFFCCSHEGINGCFSLKTFFFEGEASEVNIHSFKEQPRKQKRKKSYATHTRRGGAISIKLFPTQYPPRLRRGKKREIERQFFPIFQIQDLETIRHILEIG